MKIKTVQMIETSDWDSVVKETYQRPYCFQQQHGCRDRGTHWLVVPDPEYNDSEMNDSVPEIVNGPEMGVKFAAWLARDPAQPLQDQKWDWELPMWWERNFYPEIEAVANDLHAKGLLPAGEYIINIDW
jgi:hypothetical protein